ncbi:translocon-associated protein subunit alpha [Phlebotomus papatasi]|nr:translocon-associated protein subunit alpha [Phlebotomus papatasi]
MKKLLLVVLLVLPAILFTVDSGNKLMTWAEDELEDEVVDVEGEDAAVVGDDVEPEEEGDSTASPDADTYLLFTQPTHSPGNQLELPAGHPVDFLVGFLNKGSDDFVIETVEASFRYPMDFNYFIQNFSAIAYNREVKPRSEATVLYTFIPSEHFGGRPFGLNIALGYRDASGQQFSEAVFNETVMIYEVDEGLDGETFFLYVFLAGIVVLLLVVGQQFLAGSVGKRKRGNVQRKTIETGTNSNDVDYDWLPEETLRALQKSPNSKLSPKKGSNKPHNQQSPKQRKAKRAAGSDD